MVDAGSIVDRLLKLGAEDGDFTLTRSGRLTVKFTDKIETVRYTSSYSIGLRVAVGKRVGFYTSNDLSPEGVEEATEMAVKIARVSPEDPYWVRAPKGLGATEVRGVYDGRLAEFTSEEAVDLVLSAIEGVSSVKPGVKCVDGLLEVATRELTIANLSGEEVSRRGTQIFIMVTGKAEKDGESATYMDFQRSRSLDGVKPKELGREVGLKAYEFLDAKPIPTGIYDMILNGDVAASIFWLMVSHAVSADSVQMGRSPLAGKLGDQIMSKLVTFVDDGTVPGYLGSRPCDDEGIPVRRNLIVEGGVLKTYLYDTYTANKEGRESTGNAYRGRIPATRPYPNNLILNPGNHSFDEMVEETSRGIYVLKTIGEWLSNPVSGLLNATVTHGYLVSKGSIEGRVKGVVLSGDFYRLMRERLKGLSKELRYALQPSYSPHVWFESVQLSSR